MGTPHDADAITRRLRNFALALQERLGSAVTVESDESGVRTSAELRPGRQDALGVSWVDFGNEIVLSTAGGIGGRWELGRTEADIDFLEDLVTSVVAGRVVEVTAGDRSRIEVTLADGSVAVETGSVGLRALLPKPGWKRWGRRNAYASYGG